MARMLPSTISPDIKSNAERKIFEWFKEANGTDDWIVLHSLGISNHNRNIFGETDFFVLMPNFGIFALEVKGGRVQRKDGVWYFTNRYGKTSSKQTGPFDQARNSSFSIVNFLKSKLDREHMHLEGVFFGSGVMFPDIVYQTTGIDEEQWQVFDSRDKDNIREYMLRLARNSIEKWEKTYGPLNPIKLPTHADVKYLANLLRGDFDKIISIDVQVRYAEEALIKLTSEQYRCLDQLEDNPRCLISGSAGTGKTLLAIEEAKRCAADGERVALFCYNNTLADWLQFRFQELSDNIKPAYIGTFHKYMSELLFRNNVNLHMPEKDNLSQFFSVDLPNEVCNLLLHDKEKFDKIIIDESQDLITPEYLEVLDLILRKGIERGRWVMLGDFESQAIYANDISGEDMKEWLEIMTSFISYRLTINCRNTRPIIREIKTVTGFETPKNLLSKVDGPPVQYISCKSSFDMRKNFEKLINTLTTQNIHRSDITVLSPKKRSNSIVSEVKRVNIEDYNVEGNKEVSFSTIQSFKGLENTIIVIVDIDSFSMEKLMYVGMSRARSALYILETEEAAEEYNSIFQRRYLNE
jgi:superfamily I DNA/RNA helicase